MLLRVVASLRMVAGRKRGLAQVVYGLEDSRLNIALHARSREGDGAEFLGRQPVSAASNVDDRLGYSLARVPILMCFLFQLFSAFRRSRAQYRRPRHPEIN